MFRSFDTFDAFGSERIQRTGIGPFLHLNDDQSFRLRSAAQSARRPGGLACDHAVRFLSRRLWRLSRIVGAVESRDAHCYLPKEYSTTIDGMNFAVRPVDVSERSTLAETSHVSAIFHLTLPTASAR